MSQRLSKGVKPVHSSCKLLCNVDVSHGPIKQKCRRCVAVNMGMHLPDDPTGWKCRHCLAGGPHWLQKVVLLHSNGVIAVWGTQVALASTSSHQQARALCAVRLLPVLQLFLLYGRTLITSTSAWGHIILRVFNWKLLLSDSELLSA